MKYWAIDESTEYVEHYGRKGMKWYQHIYGSDKTSSERKTSSSSQKSSKEAAQKAYAKKIYQQRLAEKAKIGAFRKREREEARKKEAQKQVKQTERREQERQKALKTPKSFEKNVKLFSNDEIAKQRERFKAEEDLHIQLRDSRLARIERGAQFIGNLKPAFDTLNTAWAFYMNVRKMQAPKTEDKKENKKEHK